MSDLWHHWYCLALYWWITIFGYIVLHSLTCFVFIFYKICKSNIFLKHNKYLMNCHVKAGCWGKRFLVSDSICVYVCVPLSKKHPIGFLISRYVRVILWISCEIIRLICFIRPKNIEDFPSFHNGFLRFQMMVIPIILKFHHLLKWKWNICIIDLNVNVRYAKFFLRGSLVNPVGLITFQYNCQNCENNCITYYSISCIR